MPDSRQAAREKALSDAKASLARMQQFDTSTLPRVDDLGAHINFNDAVEPATKLIGLYQQLSIDVLVSLPIPRLNTIKSNADSNFNQLDNILKFEPGTPRATRDSLIQQLYDAYDPAFEALAETISYSVRRSTDFEKLGRDARAVIQGVQDDANGIRKELVEFKQEAQATLVEIKKVAAEQGVSQQAIHFKTEGDGHAAAAGKWLKATVVMTGVLGVYAILTLFLHHFAWLKPASTYESVQLTVSKTLIFATIFFMLVLCARNYLAHRHNAIVNKHRQNALATYTAIVKAANVPTNSDIVLNKAADCIFTPQPTGYSKGGADGGSSSLLTVGPNSLKAPGT
jgi:hypothetical protein